MAMSTQLFLEFFVSKFENTTMVTALIDRLTFRSHVLNMNSEHPYRAEHAAKVNTSARGGKKHAEAES